MYDFESHSMVISICATSGTLAEVEGFNLQFVPYSKSKSYKKAKFLFPQGLFQKTLRGRKNMNQKLRITIFILASLKLEV